MNHTFTIEHHQEGVRIDAFLAQHLEVSRSRAQEALATTLVNGKVVKAKYSIKAGDVIEVTLPEVDEAVTTIEVTEPMPEVLFEDDSLLVIVKPRGLTVHAGAGETGATLVDILRHYKVPLSNVGPTERAGIVHRLDKDTSGVMLVAKTDAAHWKLAADFEARNIQKTYFALCNGIPPLKGRIEAPIARSNSNRKKMTVSPEGRYSVTEYEVTQKWEKFAALKVNLLTGRTHQIRVHLNYINHGIVGDVVYGGYYRSVASAPNEETKKAIEAMNGQALLAQKIAFNHPITGERLEFEAPIDPFIAAVVAALNMES
jgi:23S rRNA pseudouridine1911/1915/1917 synthase